MINGFLFWESSKRLNAIIDTSLIILIFPLNNVLFSIKSTIHIVHSEDLTGIIRHKVLMWEDSYFLTCSELHFICNYATYKIV